jgi:hypothetical protein
MDNPNDLWTKFWLPFLCRDDTATQEEVLEAVKKELFDYFYVLKNVQETYGRLTGGEITSPFTDPDVIIAYADQYYSDMMDYQEKGESEGEESFFVESYEKRTLH